MRLGVWCVRPCTDVCERGAGAHSPRASPKTKTTPKRSHTLDPHPPPRPPPPPPTAPLHSFGFAALKARRARVLNLL